MPSISVKELREKLPLVRSELKKGTTFLIIYQSKPIAKLTPVDDIPVGTEATDADWGAATLDSWEEEPALSKEELNYYLSLKPYK
jgi:antitoxin (DNA-binding transcriptional repressor) of toxin-antitoxin stability system